MKKIVAVLMLVIMFSISSCQNHTEYGSCVGIVEPKDPNLEYNLSGENVFWAVIFSETIIVPIMVLESATFCPTGKAKHPPLKD